MWHNVTEVAKIHRLPELEFVQFALDNAKKFSIVKELGSGGMVNTWNVDKLVDDFKKSAKYSFLLTFKEYGITHQASMFMLEELNLSNFLTISDTEIVYTATWVDYRAVLDLLHERGYDCVGMTR